jgi:hypothetical protein
MGSEAVIEKWWSHPTRHCHSVMAIGSQEMATRADTRWDRLATMSDWPFSNHCSRGRAPTAQPEFAAGPNGIFPWCGMVPVAYSNPLFNAIEDFKPLMPLLSDRTMIRCRVYRWHYHWASNCNTLAIVHRRLQEWLCRTHSLLSYQSQET